MMLLIDSPTITIKPLINPLTVHDNGSIRIGRSRVSLASVMYAYEQGESAELIQESYPSLTLDEVYATITWMLQNDEFMAAYKEDIEAQWVRLKADIDQRFPQSRLRRMAAEHFGKQT